MHGCLTNITNKNLVVRFCGLNTHSKYWVNGTDEPGAGKNPGVVPSAYQFKAALDEHPAPAPWKPFQR